MTMTQAMNLIGVAILLCSAAIAAAESAHVVNARDFGAVGDGAADDTAAIQKALDEAGKLGGEASLPAGRYLLKGGLSVPSGVTLVGVWRAPHHARLKTGTVLLAVGGRGDADGTPLISLAPSSGVRGLTIFYPEQKADAVEPYPWTIQGGGMHCSVIDVTLVNPYKGIDFGTRHNELHYVRNVFGCPLKVGVYINNCTDIGRIENVHFNPHYWGRSEGDEVPRPKWDDLLNYILANGEGFVFGRADWEYVINTFCYGYKVGYKFIKTPQGLCNGNFLGIGADGTEHAVEIEDCAPYGLLITNGEFVSMRAKDATQIVVGPGNRGTAQFNNCAFWGPTDRCALIKGRGTISFSQCNFVHWDRAKKGYEAIKVEGGNVSIQGCRFHVKRSHIALGPDVTSAVILGNQMSGAIDIDNQSKGSVQIGLNVSTDPKSGQ